MTLRWEPTQEYDIERQVKPAKYEILLCADRGTFEQTNCSAGGNPQPLA